MIKKIEGTLLILVGIGLGMILGLLIGFVAGTAEIRVEAIENGAAYWEIETDGSTIFHWNSDEIEINKN